MAVNLFIAAFFGFALTAFGVVAADAFVALVAFGLDNYHTTPGTLVGGAMIMAVLGWGTLLYKELSKED